MMCDVSKQVIEILNKHKAVTERTKELLMSIRCDHGDQLIEINPTLHMRISDIIKQL